MGIRAKLVLCLLVVLVPIIAVSVFSIQVLDRQMLTRTEAALSNMQRLEAARITEILNGYAQDSRSLAAEIHLKTFVDAVDGIYDGRLPSDTVIGGYDGFSIVDPDAALPLQQLTLDLQRKAGMIGFSVAEIRLVERDGLILGESPGFTWEPQDPTLISESMRKVKTRFGNAFRTEDDQDRLGIVTPIISHMGEVVGALILETPLSPITDMISKHEGFGYSSEAHIVQRTADGNAQLITPLRFDRKAAFDKIVSQDSRLPINESLLALGGRVIHAKDYRGVESILAIETLPDVGWGLVVKVDTAEAFEPIIELRQAIMLAALASVIFVLAGYQLCLHPLARRLQKTAAAAQKVMDGDLTTRVCDPVNDEIGHTARSLDLLAHDLEEDQRKRTLVEEQLRYQASHDELTGLLNRKYANTLISQLNEETHRTHSLMFLDLNGFKDVNDLYGHSAGDEVLITIAQRLSGNMHAGATLARWGGDEFVIIMPNTSEQSATELALTVHRTFDEPIKTSQGTHSLSCSIGLAASSATKSLEQVLVEADTLMYRQKKSQQCHRSVDGIASRTLERALNENRIEIWYQPIVSILKPGKLTLMGAEALVRLRSRDGGIVLPGDFLPDANQTSLGMQLDQRVLSLSMQSLARWRTAGIVHEDFRLSVNITGNTLLDPGFNSMLARQLHEAAINPQQIIIEIPETAQLLDPNVIAQLRTLGFTIALDDVGVERANLDRLTSLKPDIAKLDRQWLDHPIILPHLVAICRELDMHIVAEGIETREQLARLHELGVYRFQGFLFDKPCPAVQFVSRWGDSSFDTAIDGVSTIRNTLRLAG